MQFLLQRGKGDGYTPGKLLIDDPNKPGEKRLLCYTLERPAGSDHPRIPAGTYKVALTESARARRGSLWTPDNKTFRLPELLAVPDRTAIRMHAGNLVTDTEGCILVGLGRVANALSHSRDALKAVMVLHEEPCEITIKEAE